MFTDVPYIVERRAAEGEDWGMVGYCRSLVYAELIARTGVRGHLAESYRAIDLQTGEATELVDALAQAV